VLAGYNPGQGGARIVYGVEKGNEDAESESMAFGGGEAL
jgi:hypothetical protein